MRNNSVFKSDSHTGRHAKTHKETKGRDLARVGATNAPTLGPIKAGGASGHTHIHSYHSLIAGSWRSPDSVEGDAMK